jgi:hypothetical protein
MCCTSNLIIMYFVFFFEKKSFPLFGIHFLKLDTFWSIPSNISKKSLIIIILIIVFLFSWIYHYFWCFFALIIISLLIAFSNIKFSRIWDDYCISVQNFSMDLLQFFFFSNTKSFCSWVYIELEWKIIYCLYDSCGGKMFWESICSHCELRRNSNIICIDGGLPHCIFTLWENILLKH